MEIRLKPLRGLSKPKAPRVKLIPGVATQVVFVEPCLMWGLPFLNLSDHLYAVSYLDDESTKGHQSL